MGKLKSMQKTKASNGCIEQPSSPLPGAAAAPAAAKVEQTESLHVILTKRIRKYEKKVKQIEITEEKERSGAQLNPEQSLLISGKQRTVQYLKDLQELRDAAASEEEEKQIYSSALIVDVSKRLCSSAVAAILYREKNDNATEPDLGNANKNLKELSKLYLSLAKLGGKWNEEKLEAESEIPSSGDINNWIAEISSLLKSSMFEDGENKELKGCEAAIIEDPSGWLKQHVSTSSSPPLEENSKIASSVHDALALAETTKNVADTGSVAADEVAHDSKDMYLDILKENEKAPNTEDMDMANGVYKPSIAADGNCTAENTLPEELPAEYENLGKSTAKMSPIRFGSVTVPSKPGFYAKQTNSTTEADDLQNATNGTLLGFKLPASKLMPSKYLSPRNVPFMEGSDTLLPMHHKAAALPYANIDHGASFLTEFNVDSNASSTYPTVQAWFADNSQDARNQLLTNVELENEKVLDKFHLSGKMIDKSAGDNSSAFGSFNFMVPSILSAAKNPCAGSPLPNDSNNVTATEAATMYVATKYPYSTDLSAADGGYNSLSGKKVNLRSEIGVGVEECELEPPTTNIADQSLPAEKYANPEKSINEQLNTIWVDLSGKKRSFVSNEKDSVSITRMPPSVVMEDPGYANASLRHASGGDAMAEMMEGDKDSQARRNEGNGEDERNDTGTLQYVGRREGTLLADSSMIQGDKFVADKGHVTSAVTADDTVLLPAAKSNCYETLDSSLTTSAAHASAVGDKFMNCVTEEGKVVGKEVEYGVNGSPLTIKTSSANQTQFSSKQASHQQPYISNSEAHPNRPPASMKASYGKASRDEAHHSDGAPPKINGGANLAPMLDANSSIPHGAHSAGSHIHGYMIPSAVIHHPTVVVGPRHFHLPSISTGADIMDNPYIGQATVVSSQHNIAASHAGNGRGNSNNPPNSAGPPYSMGSSANGYRQMDRSGDYDAYNSRNLGGRGRSGKPKSGMNRGERPPPKFNKRNGYGPQTQMNFTQHMIGRPRNSMGWGFQA